MAKRAASQRRKPVEDTGGTGRPADLGVLQALVTETLLALGENPGRNGLLKTPERVAKALGVEAGRLRLAVVTAVGIALTHRRLLLLAMDPTMAAAVGMRVGVWRFLDVFERLGITPSVCLNAKVIETRPRLAHAMKDAGWEFIAHCYEQMHIARIEDQRAMLRQTIAVMQPFLGTFPAGWLGPGRGQTFATMDYIAEAGFTWFADYVMDDLPFWCRTRHGPILAMPYTSEMNDIPVMVGAQHESHVFIERCKLHFDTLLREAVATDSARVMCVSVHPYVSGAAHRIGLFEEMLAWLKGHPNVVFMTGQGIYDWYRAQDPAIGI